MTANFTTKKSSRFFHFLGNVGIAGFPKQGLTAGFFDCLQNHHGGRNIKNNFCSRIFFANIAGKNAGQKVVFDKLATRIINTQTVAIPVKSQA